MSDRVYENFQNSTPFLRGYRQLKIPIIDGGIPAWPELFPVQKIDELRETVGQRHFSAQMMLEYIAEDRARLDPGALTFYDGEFDPKTAQIVTSNQLSVTSESGETGHGLLVTGYSMYWDPSGGRARADGSVCVLIYRDDKNRRAFIHDVKYLTVDDEDMHPLATQCEQVLDFMRGAGQYRIAIETNGMGSALPEVLRDIAKRRGQNVVVQKIANHTRKETRILDAIEPLLSTGRLFAHERVRRTPLMAEMLGWSPLANGIHDDGLDALAGALRTQPTPIRALGTTFRPLVARTEFKV